jgi:hypothetical protein
MYYPDDELDSKWHSSKNTKRWCRGRVGREHIPVTAKNKFSLNRDCHYVETRYWNGNERRWWYCIHEIVCKNCGKVLEWRVDDCPDKNG